MLAETARSSCPGKELGQQAKPALRAPIAGRVLPAPGFSWQVSWLDDARQAKSFPTVMRARGCFPAIRMEGLG